MAGIVIVSHSRALAEALMDLVRQVSSPDVSMAVAAGVGSDRQELGTDAVEIAEAIQRVYSEDGVLVLMDLGSAILSAELALELLPEELRSGVRFCPAPLVEGAVAAGVQAKLGGDVETLCREAMGALLPKQEQLGVQPEEQGEKDSGFSDTQPGGTVEVRLRLGNAHGLHARPAARFVQTAAAFDADVRVQNLTTGKGPVSARSLNALATLGALKDHEVGVIASGPQAEDAVQALAHLVESNFGEPETEAPAPLSAPAPVPSGQEQAARIRDGAIQATPISEGVALGPLFTYRPSAPPVPEGPALDPQADWERLERALEGVRADIEKRARELRGRVGAEEAGILDAHLLIAGDPELLESARRAIFEERRNAAAAWDAAIQVAAESYRTLPDPYLQQRAADVLDVGRQGLLALAGKSASASLRFAQPVVLYAQELDITETAQLDLSQVLGLITAGGGPTSHSAILARALGIPAVAGVGAALEGLADSTRIALDGGLGAVWVAPDQDMQARLLEQRSAWLEERRRLLDAGREPAVTRDGRRVEVVANIGSAADARAAVANGAEGVGLLRTEFLFLGRQTPPAEEEQLAALREIGEAMGGLPVIVRTLDAGGDKELPFLPMPTEPNPFLGVRAVRLSLLRPELFQAQLRAILRAAADFPLKVMFPMVATVAEVEAARGQLQAAHDALEAGQQPHAWPIETGIMVEIPSAALLAEALARRVDFFSIGTNDLTQYTLAAERGNPALSALADGLHPAVLRLIDGVSQAAHRHGKWTGVCGELAGDPLAAPILLGLGVDELSLNPAGIPRLKAVIRSLAMADARALAQQALAAESAGEVRKLAQGFS